MAGSSGLRNTSSVSVLTTALGGLTTMTAIGALAVDHELYRRMTEWSDRSVYRGVGDRLSVALTFDDGPSPQTPLLLELLRSENIRATFFQLGMQLERYPDIAQQVHAAGHEIGNHAWSHTSLSPEFGPKLRIPSPRSMYRELSRTQDLLTELHGHPPRLFRPPYGHHWTGLHLVQSRLNLVGVQWTVIAHDWEWPATRIASYVLSRVVPGAIICLHDGRDIQPSPDISETLAAVGILVRSLRERGYSFETVSQILRPATAPLPSAARGRELAAAEKTIPDHRLAAGVHPLPYGNASRSASSALPASSSAPRFPRSMPSSSQTSRKASILS